MNRRALVFSLAMSGVAARSVSAADVAADYGEFDESEIRSKRFEFVEIPPDNDIGFRCFRPGRARFEDFWGNTTPWLDETEEARLTALMEKRWPTPMPAKTPEQIEAVLKAWASR